MRALLVVIDSFGIGALPDAHVYGDSGANTALHICEGMEEVRWFNLRQMGLGNCAELLGYVLPGCESVIRPLASYGVMREASPGKDTTTGHWELAGIIMEEPFATFPLTAPSFPDELITELEARTGYKVLGNKGASGTVIIEELGPQHMAGQGLIIYTSADSVLQIAAHEEIVPVTELYKICEIARELCNGFGIGRVIARPFTGQPGSFTRTASRRDFSMLPVHATILDYLQQSNVETTGIGKIGDIFCEQGIDNSYHDSGNDACLQRIFSCLRKKTVRDQFLFANLVDTDMLYGHRRDIRGYHDAVAEIDAALGKLMGMLEDDDLLFITADHGCDPGYEGTDHTREYVPLLMFSNKGEVRNLGVRQSFSDVAQTLAAIFGLAALDQGKSFVN